MKKNSKMAMTTKTLAYCALLSALSVALARLFGMMPNEASRFSIEAVPIFLAGMLFGPLPGALVGFTADAVGCLFSPYGYNPIFCIPPILYGLSAGLFRKFLCKNVSALRIGLIMLLPVTLGSVLYQSASLAYMYYDGLFLKGFIFYLSTRSLQFAVTFVVDVLIVFLLCKSKMFHRMGVWPAGKDKI